MITFIIAIDNSQILIILDKIKHHNNDKYLEFRGLAA